MDRKKVDSLVGSMAAGSADKMVASSVVERALLRAEWWDEKMVAKKVVPMAASKEVVMVAHWVAMLAEL